MKNIKNEVLQIRLTELEKCVIKDKADILGITVTDYVKECCIFNNVTQTFIANLHSDLNLINKKWGGNEVFNSLNAEQEALLKQLELPEEISIQETIKVLENINVRDVELFEKSFNEEMLNSTIMALKNTVK